MGLVAVAVGHHLAWLTGVPRERPAVAAVGSLAMEPVAIWRRAPIAVATLLLVVGAALGFGLGYSVGDHGGKTTTSVTTRTNPAKKKLTPAQLRLNALLACMARHGVAWPKGPASRISKAPAGVSDAKYRAALSACYAAAARPTTTTTRATGP